MVSEVIVVAIIAAVGSVVGAAVGSAAAVASAFGVDSVGTVFSCCFAPHDAKTKTAKTHNHIITFFKFFLLLFINFSKKSY